MSDTVKLIIEIPRNEYEYTCERTLSDRSIWDNAIRKGIPLDDVKNKILGYNVRQHVFGSESFLKGIALGMDKSVEILDNIGKGE